MRVRRVLVEGAAAGLAGTAAMTVAMTPTAAGGRPSERPPLRITRHLLPSPVLRRARGGRPLAVLAHTGYGATAGALFGLLVRRRPAVWGGAAYGTALWLAAYEGWVPAMGAMPPAHRDRPQRAVRVAAGHVVYGTVLAAVLRALRGLRERDQRPR